MFIKAISTLLSILLITFATNAASSTENLFLDLELESCVREAIKKPSGELTIEDVSSLTHLECQDRSIWNIDGIENLKALTKLSLWENHITNLAPLSELVNLTWLQLGNNEIVDLDPLTNLINLTRLGLAINYIEDIGVIEELTDLEWLNLDNNRLVNDDLNSLCCLDSLKWLTLEHNRLTSISELRCLARKGCDIYWEPKVTSASGASTPNIRVVHKDIVPDLSAKSDSPAIRPVIDGDLVVHTDHQSEVSFRYIADNLDLPVIKEYAGTIILEGSTFVYHTEGGTFDIGEMTDSGFVICSENYADICSLTTGRKGPGHETHDHDDAGESMPVITMALNINHALRTGPDNYATSSFVSGADTFMDAHNLSPHVLASPNQFDAGTCLFMATTGAMEMLMNQHYPLDQIAYKGNTDLSERYLMNVSSDVLPEDITPYYLTDMIYAYNFLQGSMLDLDYPFILDLDSEGNLSAATNWENDLPVNWPDMLVTTPTAERTVIFVDPLKDEHSRWRVAIADHDIIDIIKHELVSKNAPVVIVYNHFNYWHSDIIVGYDDNQASGGCPMVVESLKYYLKRGKINNVVKILLHMLKLGGCLDKGVFYVRDSIYDGGPDEPDYVYNEEIPFVGKYSKPIIERTYNWVLYLANHGYAIHRKK